MALRRRSKSSSRRRVAATASPRRRTPPTAAAAPSPAGRRVASRASAEPSGARAALRALADPRRARALARFFKTGPGEYGAGDAFLGVSVPQIRKLARAHDALDLPHLAALLRSKWHEERLLALVILVERFEQGDEGERTRVFGFYLENLACVNNWDLVDASASFIVGAHALARAAADPSRGVGVLRRLARSPVLWERRVAIVGTHAFIRAGVPGPTFEIAKLLLGDRHDLIHKAVGWMLREVGKRVSEAALRDFLAAHAAAMPRTTLRYAIERFPTPERRRWMAVAPPRDPGRR